MSPCLYSLIFVMISHFILAQAMRVSLRGRYKSAVPPYYSPLLEVAKRSFWPEWDWAPLIVTEEVSTGPRQGPMAISEGRTIESAYCRRCWYGNSRASCRLCDLERPSQRGRTAKRSNAAARAHYLEAYGKASTGGYGYYGIPNSRQARPAGKRALFTSFHDNRCCHHSFPRRECCHRNWYDKRGGLGYGGGAEGRYLGNNNQPFSSNQDNANSYNDAFDQGSDDALDFPQHKDYDSSTDLDLPASKTDELNQDDQKESGTEEKRAGYDTSYLSGDALGSYQCWCCDSGWLYDPGCCSRSCGKKR